MYCVYTKRNSSKNMAIKPVFATSEGLEKLRNGRSKAARFWAKGLLITSKAKLVRL